MGLTPGSMGQGGADRAAAAAGGGGEGARAGNGHYGAVLWVWPPSMGLALDLWG